MSVNELNPPILNISAPDVAAAGTAPAMAGAEATTTGTEPIAPAEMQGTPVPASGTSANAEVPTACSSLTVQPPISLLPADQALSLISTQPSIAAMTLDQKFETLKEGLSIVGGIRKILVEVFESIRDEFKTYAKDRKGMPTVEEAFKLRGMNYKTIDSRIRREKELRLEYAQFETAILL